MSVASLEEILKRVGRVGPEMPGSTSAPMATFDDGDAFNTEVERQRQEWSSLLNARVSLTGRAEDVVEWCRRDAAERAAACVAIELGSESDD